MVSPVSYAWHVAVICLPVEVGSRGYTDQTPIYCSRKLGLGRQRTETLFRSAADQCFKCSFLVWVLWERKMWKKSAGSRKTWCVPSSPFKKGEEPKFENSKKGS